MFLLFPIRNLSTGTGYDVAQAQSFWQFRLAKSQLSVLIERLPDDRFSFYLQFSNKCKKQHRKSERKIDIDFFVNLPRRFLQSSSFTKSCMLHIIKIFLQVNTTLEENVKALLTFKFSIHKNDKFSTRFLSNNSMYF